jgi:hypothetical protein
MIAATLITSFFAATALAQPNALRQRDNTCLSYDQAYKVASTWGSLISNYSTAVAEASLVEHFTDYSESVNALINNCPQGSAAVSLPLLDPTFTNRSAFELGQGQQPPINFNLLQVFPGCGSVAFRWMTTNTAPIPNVRPIVGLIVLETVPNPVKNTGYEFLISTVYSEFDSADWLQNLKDAGICATTTSACATAPTSTVATSSSVAPTTSVASTSIVTSTLIKSTTTSAGGAAAPVATSTTSARAPPKYTKNDKSIGPAAYTKTSTEIKPKAYTTKVPATSSSTSVKPKEYTTKAPAASSSTKVTAPKYY